MGKIIGIDLGLSLIHIYWRWIGGIAATILVLVGVGYGITNMGEDMRPPTPQDLSLIHISQNLQDTPYLFVTADDGIQFAAAGCFVQIDGILFQ